MATAIPTAMAVIMETATTVTEMATGTRQIWIARYDIGDLHHRAAAAVAADSHLSNIAGFLRHCADCHRARPVRLDSQQPVGISSVIYRHLCRYPGSYYFCSALPFQSR